MTPYNAAFFGLYEKVFLQAKEDLGEKKSLEFMTKLFSRALRPAYDAMGFKKGNHEDFARVVKERDDGVGIIVAFPLVTTDKIIYQFHTDPFPNLKGAVDAGVLDDCYLSVKISHILGDGYGYTTTKHLWNGDPYSEHIICKKE